MIRAAAAHHPAPPRSIEGKNATAYSVVTLPALGADGEVCANCDRAFARGDTMTAVEADEEVIAPAL